MVSNSQSKAVKSNTILSVLNALELTKLRVVEESKWLPGRRVDRSECSHVMLTICLQNASVVVWVRLQCRVEDDAQMTAGEGIWMRGRERVSRPSRAKQGRRGLG